MCKKRGQHLGWIIYPTEEEVDSYYTMRQGGKCVEPGDQMQVHLSAVLTFPNVTADGEIQKSPAWGMVTKGTRIIEHKDLGHGTREMSRAAKEWELSMRQIYFGMLWLYLFSIFLKKKIISNSEEISWKEVLEVADNGMKKLS